jgi:hypothetical protein
MRGPGQRLVRCAPLRSSASAEAFPNSSGDHEQIVTETQLTIAARVQTSLLSLLTEPPAITAWSPVRSQQRRPLTGAHKSPQQGPDEHDVG